MEHQKKHITFGIMNIDFKLAPDMSTEKWIVDWNRNDRGRITTVQENEFYIQGIP